MANFVVILSGLLFLAQVEGQPALQGNSRDSLGMLVVAVLMISTLLLISRLALDVFSNLMLESKSAINYWWKAFVVFLDEGILRQLSGFFFGLQMAQFSPLSSQILKDTQQLQKKQLKEKLSKLDDEMSLEYSNSGNYFRNAHLMEILYNQAVKKVHRIQDTENSDFAADVADLKKIESLPEIQSMGIMHQIKFNEHPVRLNDKDPPIDYKHYVLDALKVTDRVINASSQHILLAFLIIAEDEGTCSHENSDYVEFNALTLKNWRALQGIIFQTSKKLLDKTHFSEPRSEMQPLLSTWATDHV
jgi:hypothetical protein